MRTFVFASNDDSKKPITITAASEDEARRLAMLEFWGPPRGIFGNLGTGLYLISQEQVHD